MQHPQEYDSSLKALLQQQTPEILGLLIEGAEFVGELNSEVLKPQTPLRVDKVYEIRYRQQLHVFHLELETGSNKKMSRRMLVYNALLYEEHEKPVISMVMYPFRTTLPETPLRVFSGEQEIIHFDYRVLPLWELLAQHIIDKHATAMYPLLPTMKEVNATMMIQAIEELILVYNGRELSNRLKWFRTFLNRVTTLPAAEKHIVKEKLEMFEELLDQDPDIRKRVELAEQRAEKRGEKIGEKRGEKRGRIQQMHETLITFVNSRFPSLTELVQQKVTKVEDPEVLNNLSIKIFNASNEETVRSLLSTLTN